MKITNVNRPVLKYFHRFFVVCPPSMVVWINFNRGPLIKNLGELLGREITDKSQSFKRMCRWRSSTSIQIYNFKLFSRSIYTFRAQRHTKKIVHFFSCCKTLFSVYRNVKTVFFVCFMHASGKKGKKVFHSLWTFAGVAKWGGKSTSMCLFIMMITVVKSTKVAAGGEWNMNINLTSIHLTSVMTWNKNW